MIDFFTRRRRNNKDTFVKERPCEDTVRKQPPPSQGEPIPAGS
jgi:hypothetical protein